MEHATKRTALEGLTDSQRRKRQRSETYVDFERLVYPSPPPPDLKPVIGTCTAPKITVADERRQPPCLNLTSHHVMIYSSQRTAVKDGAQTVKMPVMVAMW